MYDGRVSGGRESFKLNENNSLLVVFPGKKISRLGGLKKIQEPTNEDPEKLWYDTNIVELTEGDWA